MYYLKRLSLNIGLDEFISTLPERNRIQGGGKAFISSINLLLDIITNVLISILSATKIMIYIRAIETFSILSQLVLECLRDVIPFTVFLFLWLSYFCTI